MSGNNEELRVRLLIDSLSSSKAVPDPKKQELAADLEYAMTINGDPDPSHQMNKRILISGVDREIQAYERHAALKSDLALIVTSALDNHTRNCVLMLAKANAEAERKAKAQDHIGDTFKAKTEQGSSSIKIGKLLEAKGGAATVVAVVATFAIVVVGWVTWQNAKTREVIKQSMNVAVQEALSAK